MGNRTTTLGPGEPGQDQVPKGDAVKGNEGDRSPFQLLVPALSSNLWWLLGPREAGAKSWHPYGRGERMLLHPLLAA